MPILVVDDDVVFRDCLADVLRSAGHDVEVAPDGVTALARCRLMRVELVVADWIMPGLDGVALCGHLKAEPALRATYVILLTARETLPDKVAALDAGADEYLVKPCADGEILARVRAGLRIRRLQEELAQMEWRLAMRELATTLGHTINNPLTVIANYLEMFEQSVGTDAAVPDMLAGARHEVTRIATIIRRLMNLREPRRIATPLGSTMLDLDPAE